MNYSDRRLGSFFRLALVAVLAVLLATPAFAQQPQVIYDGRPAVAEQVIIRLRNDDPGTLNQARSAAPFATLQSLSPGLALHLVRAPGSSVANLIQAFSNRPEVLYVEPNYIFQSQIIPNDTSFASLYGMLKIEAPAAWDTITGGTSFVAGDIDSGIDYNHPDLAANIWSAPTMFTVHVGGSDINCPAGSHGYNAIANSCLPLDDNNHGSHTTGTIGAKGNNSLGVAGVNWDARIMGLKFLNAAGNGSTSDAIDCIEFAIQVKALFASTATPVNVRVLSNSWGGGGFAQSLLDEIIKANTNDMLFVAAAGNNGANNDTTPFYPANYVAPNIIAVAATDSSDTLAGFSNYGLTKVHLGAPGVGILSTVRNGGYSFFNGTSMATPHVAGAALLLLAACPNLSTAALKNAILTTVDPVPSLAGQTTTGGRLNVNKMIQSCKTNWALASNGGTAVASSTYNGGYPASATINGDRTGAGWGSGGGWNDGTLGAFPDTLEVDFSGTKSISEIDVSTLQDNFVSPVPPTSGMTFSLYGVTDFSVEYWNGAAWVAVPGGVVSGNNLVWRQFIFAPVNTTKIRVVVTGALAGYSRLAEVEAYGTAVSGTPPGAFGKTSPSNGATGLSLTPTITWGTSSGAASYEYCVDMNNNNACDTSWTSTAVTNATLGPLVGTTTYWWQVRAQNVDGTTQADSGTWWSFTTTSGPAITNVALASNGGTAVASSTYNGGYPASATINGDRTGAGWGSGGGWNDGTLGVFPDTLEVDFSGTKSISEIDVSTLQDNFVSPVPPTSGMTFSLYGVTDFSVEYWNGAAWVAVPGGVVSGNNKVWRQFIFAPVNTTKIRVVVTGALAGYSRLAEVEAYGTAVSGTPPGAFGKTSPSNGATGLSLTPTITWGTSSGAASYEYCVDMNNNNACDTSWTSTAVTNATLGPLVGTTTYWWQVRAQNVDGTTQADSGTWWSFTTTSGPAITNVALASNGGTAVASSTYNGGYPASATINGDRTGAGWGSGGGWNDGTLGVFPDTLEVDFSGTKSISEIDVSTLQDNFVSPVPPTSGMTFSLYGVTDFSVEYWNGAAWVAVPGGVVSGNNKVWRQFIFAPVNTTSIRVVVTGALAGYSRLVEVEAYGF